MHQPFTIADIRTENYRTKTFCFDRALPAEPGQFVMAWLPDVDERPFSVAGSMPLTLTVVAVGSFTDALHRLHVGDRLWIRGPLGQGFALPTSPTHHRLLLVGGGYGVAPLRFLARTALGAGYAVEVCIGARTAADVILTDQFRRDGADVRVATEDGSLGTQGLVTGIMETSIEANSPDVVYACGPLPMLEVVESHCLSRGLPHQLSWEARMRCGMGLCGTCEVPGRDGWLACTDGPVSRD